MGPQDLYFIEHTADMDPLYKAGIMIIIIILLLSALNFILRRRGITGRKASIINIAVNIIFLVGFLVIMEYQAKGLERKINRNLSIDTGITDLYNMDTLLLWAPKKNQHGKLYERYWKFSTDSKGIRSLVEIPYGKKENEYRILVLGDSWTFGFGVDDEQTFCYKLEKKLQEKYPKRKITVINGGCPAYSIAQGFIFLRQRGFRYRPDLVIVKGFLNGNVLPFFNRIYPLPSAKSLKHLKFLLWKSSLYLYVRRLILLRQSKQVKKEVTGVPDFDDFGYTDLMLREINNICIKKKIPVIYVNMYFRNRIFFVQPLENFSKEKNIDYIEIELDMLNDPEQVEYDSHHPGPGNHEIIAEELKKHIEKRYLK